MPSLPVIFTDYFCLHILNNLHLHPNEGSYNLKGILHIAKPVYSQLVLWSIIL